jgi:cytoplasmic iron level regulating protein YaaA (DUF328/UPF0246 family)
MPSSWFLLPPSEGKLPGGRRGSTPDRFATALGDERKVVIEALAHVLGRGEGAEQGKVLRTRGELLELALAATARIIDGDAPTLPAWQRYSGVVWEHLGPATLRPAERRRILVPSALYGLTTAEDRIAEYRLGMGVSLPGVGNLAHFWRTPITEVIRSLRRSDVLIDLLPEEHRRAIAWERVGRVVQVTFRSADGGRAVGHFAKAVKGEFARYLIDHGTSNATDFRWDGWSVLPTPSGFEVRAGL